MALSIICLAVFLKKMREKCARLQAKLFKKLETETLENDRIHQIMLQNAQLTEQITAYTENINRFYFTIRL
jgi:hypothetical protein